METFSEARSNIKRSKEESDLSGTEGTPKSRKKSQPRRLNEERSSSESEPELPFTATPSLGYPATKATMQMPPPPQPPPGRNGLGSEEYIPVASSSSQVISEVRQPDNLTETANQVNSDVHFLGSSSNGFENWMICNVSIMKAQMKTLQESVDGILHRQGSSDQTADVSIASRSTSDLFQLPVNTFAEWADFRQRTSDPDFRKWLVAKLSRRGGNNVGDCLRRVMAALMTDKFAIGFSWKVQRGGKSGFKYLGVKDMVYDAVRDNYRSSAAKDSILDKFVKDWLKNAKKRTLKAQEKVIGDAAVSDEDSE